MAIFRRVLFAAALAGLIAGVFASALHAVGTTPLIAKAETYEEESAGSTAPSAQVVDVAASAHDHDENSWTPQDGFERTAYTVLADILTGIGFALLLASAFALRGGDMDWRKGLSWGLAGFATFTLAPALGLPPALPGTAEAPLLDRQLWWLATVIATGAGLALLFLLRRPLGIALGFALLVLPHLVGAPKPAAPMSLAPASRELQFMAVAIATSFFSWLALGALTGFFYKRLQGAS